MTGGNVIYVRIETLGFTLQRVSSEGLIEFMGIDVHTCGNDNARKSPKPLVSSKSGDNPSMTHGAGDGRSAPTHPTCCPSL